MDIVVLGRMCLRRWYVVLVVFGLVAAYGLYQYSSARPVYGAKAQLIVVAASRSDSAPPSTGSPTPATDTSTTGSTGSPSPDAAPSGSSSSPVPRAGETTGAPNPLQSVQTTILALVARMQAQPGVVRTADGSAVYAVGQLSRGGPLLVVTASGSNRTAVRSALEQGIPAVSSALVALQDDVGAPVDNRFRAVTLQIDQGTTVDYPSRAKGLIVTVVVGLLVAVLVAVIADAVLSRRRNRRGRRGRTIENAPASRTGSLDALLGPAPGAGAAAVEPPVVTAPGTRARRRARSSP